MDNQQPSLGKVANKTVCRKPEGVPGYYDDKVKICVRCGITKPLDQFTTTTQGGMGRTNDCRPCRAASQVRRYQQKPLSERTRPPEVHAAIARRHKEAVFNHYGKFCRCCGETNPLFLTVDHLEPIGTKNRYEKGQNKIYSYLRQHGYPEGFQILCFNCNCGRARNAGVCPHQEGSQAISKESRDKRPEVPGIPKRDGDMVEPMPKGIADLSETFHDNPLWPFTPDRVQ